MSGQRVTVVFVHGFLSSAAVWSRFIDLIRADDDLSDIDPHTFAYASPPVSFHPLRRIPDLNDVADSLRTFLDRRLGGHHRLVLASHSQGGLVVQRMLARTLGDGRGTDLARIRQIVMFACPNSGSDLALLLRRRAWLWRHPQERDLRPLNATVTETRRTVLHQIVHATDVGPDRCPIPIVAYAGESDGVVKPEAAKNVFKDVGVLPGDHSSIIQPDSPAHDSYTALKSHLVAVLRQPPVPRPRPAPDNAAPDRAPQVSPADRSRRVVDALLAVPRMTDPSFREQVYDLLPSVIVQQLPRHSIPRIELFSLVRSFDHYPRLAPWDTLVTALTTLAPDQQPVADVTATLVDLALIDPDPHG